MYDFEEKRPELTGSPENKAKQCAKSSCGGGNAPPPLCVLKCGDAEMLRRLCQGSHRHVQVLMPSTDITDAWGSAKGAAAADLSIIAVHM